MRLPRRRARRPFREILRALVARRPLPEPAPAEPAAPAPAAPAPATPGPATPSPAAPAVEAVPPSAPEPARTPRPRGPRPPGRWFTEEYAGVSGARTYHVHVPGDADPAVPVPLLVLLHGCRQTARAFAAETRFEDLSRRHGFVLVCPEQALNAHRQRCWHWYEAAHQRRGAGEPDLLTGITREVVAETRRWRVDPARVYVAGLSAGGAMALVLATTYPDVYAAVGVHSAPPYGAATSGNNAYGAMAGHAPAPVAPGPGTPGMPPAILFHGTEDRAVRIRAGQRVADQWLAFAAAGATDPASPDRVVRHRTTDGAGQGRAHTTTRWYAANGRKVLEFWQVSGLGHAWSGGREGPFSDPVGPRAASAMWSFFTGRALPAPEKPADP